MSEAEHQSKYTPTLVEWLIPLVLACSCIVCISEGFRHPLFPQEGVAEWSVWVMLGCATLGWIVAWQQQERHPLLSELAGLAAAGCWCLSAKLLDVVYQLEDDNAIKHTALLGLIWVPWVLRQRVLFGAVVMVSVLEAEFCCRTFLTHYGSQALMTALAYGWWMLSERLRGCEGRFKGYSWVGVPMCCFFLASVLYFTMNRSQSIPVLILTPCAAALALLVRPRTTWRRWLIVVLAAALPIIACGLTEASSVICWAAALLCPATMLWLAVVQRRRELVPCCTFTIFLWMAEGVKHYTYNLPYEQHLLVMGTIFFIFIVHSVLLYRAACTPSPSHD